MTDTTRTSEPDRDLHDAYLRLRSIIPGAFITPYAPSPDQVWATTEAAAKRLVERALASAQPALAGVPEELRGLLARYEQKSFSEEWKAVREELRIAAVNYVRTLAARPAADPQGWRTMDSAPRTKPDDGRAIPFEGWCPHDEAPEGGDIHIIWWEPKLKGGCWWGDRDLPEHPVLWRALRPVPEPPAPTPEPRS